MKQKKFVVPSLIAAGLFPVSAVAGDKLPADQNENNAFKNNLDSIVSNLQPSQIYTLAAHRSHGSHGSHGSHQSHRSSSHRLAPPSVGLASADSSAESRNVASIPPSSVLPSSPAIAKKLKVLPGNSSKFARIVTRVQIALATRGYIVGKVDGTLHARTIAAIFDYEKDNGMIPTGKLNDRVLASLGISAQ